MACNRILHYWPFVKGIHKSPVYSHHKGSVIRSVGILLIARRSPWKNNRFGGDLRRHDPRVTSLCYLTVWMAVIKISLSHTLINRIHAGVDKQCDVCFIRTYRLRSVYQHGPYDIRADSRFAPSQWETALLCNDVSHWLIASLESAMDINWDDTIAAILSATINRSKQPK